ncbi:MAG: hypothetical protein HYX32_12830 [Actinobacteria bacterium]|nr:hypothetical protein [Actinomycetota bacterium]
MRTRTKGALVATLVVVGAFLATSTTPSLAVSPLGQITTIATAGVTTGFPASSDPRAITTGPDGLQWFVDSSSVNRINADGSVTNFDAVPTFGANPSLAAIVAGPDGNLWFTKFNPPGQIGKITPTGTMTAVTSFSDGNVQDIIVGPDNNLWYTKPFNTGGGLLGRVTTGGVTTEFMPPNTSPQPRFMAIGPDGNIWYTDDGGAPNVGMILKSTTAGAITPVATAGVTPGLSAGMFPYPITAGPDGNLWTAMFNSAGSAVARVTTAGVVTAFTTAGLESVRDIVSGCGSLFVSQQSDQASVASMWRVTTAGAFTRYTTGLPTGSSPQGISMGPDDDLKIADDGTTGRILDMGAGCAVTPSTSSTTSTVATSPTSVTPVVVTPRFTG